MLQPRGNAWWIIIKRSESVLAQGSERRLLLGALGEAEQSAKRKAQRCFAPKGVYATLRVDYIPPPEGVIPCSLLAVSMRGCARIPYTASRDFIQRFALYEERGPLAVDEVSWQGMSLGKFDEEKANTSSVILANARMPPSPTGEDLE